MNNLSGDSTEREDRINNIQFEWGEVTEEEVNIEVTIDFKNLNLVRNLLVNRISLSIESRGIALGEIVSNKIIIIKPASIQKENLMLTFQTENLLDWLILHINDNEDSSATLKIQTMFELLNLNLGVNCTTQVDVKTDILGKIGDRILFNTS